MGERSPWETFGRAMKDSLIRLSMQPDKLPEHTQKEIGQYALKELLDSVERLDELNT